MAERFYNEEGFRDYHMPLTREQGRALKSLSERFSVPRPDLLRAFFKWGLFVSTVEELGHSFVIREDLTC